ncbi:uncharacterized protein L969DRAFT_96465 [Mixia osmundae IAM 14324]|uniref:Uncharacterized protein n=1 Tax=Mixia osmundae (strain CBS 9802 / IAM 14324 / JCM 22182 / KY 12970) TaxID=764103 RepID=G7DWM6_MIXOS|nr:uncharacterized protein L969DRAFT_96465 [Mixia osmundae IAM 14324]KEI37387.1 hypothetical protein L969DRAFT_96465 [Mixia osmundae IAM 14324]GAA94986.1 hypothetical protein E5Q_01641 [Mixia osmundae IAM 14324]
MQAAPHSPAEARACRGDKMEEAVLILSITPSEVDTAALPTVLATSASPLNAPTSAVTSTSSSSSQAVVNTPIHQLPLNIIAISAVALVVLLTAIVLAFKVIERADRRRDAALTTFVHAKTIKRVWPDRKSEDEKTGSWSSASSAIEPVALRLPVIGQVRSPGTPIMTEQPSRKSQRPSLFDDAIRVDQTIESRSDPFKRSVVAERLSEETVRSIRTPARPPRPASLSLSAFQWPLASAKRLSPPPSIASFDHPFDDSPPFSSSAMSTLSQKQAFQWRSRFARLAWNGRSFSIASSRESLADPSVKTSSWLEFRERD